MVNVVNLPWAKELTATGSLNELTAADELAALSFKRLDHARRCELAVSGGDELAALSFKRLDHARRCEFVGRSTGFPVARMAALLIAARMATSDTRMMFAPSFEAMKMRTVRSVRPAGGFRADDAQAQGGDLNMARFDVY